MPIKFKLATENKIATVSYHWKNSLRSPYVHILVSPKIKNKTLNSILMLQKPWYLQNVFFKKRGSDLLFLVVQIMAYHANLDLC